MSYHTATAALIAICLSYSPVVAEAFQCNECHSKNPAMVKMHQAVQGRGCFGCHKIGEKLMGKGQAKDKQTLLARRAVDELCRECHAVKQ